MKKLLYILLFVIAVSTNAKANDVNSSREEISSLLTNIVRDLKLLFKDIDLSLNSNVDETKTLKEDVEYLVDRSGNGESNPTVLKHGKTSIAKLKDCDYNSQNIHWTGTQWKCQDINVMSDCVAASDEYRIDKGNGSYECKKAPKNSSVNYYWDFSGHSVQCSSTTGEHTKIYGCFYKNKQNKVIQVDLSHCSGKSKSTVATKTCTSAWATSAWGACSKSCGSGTQSRTVTCPAGKVCLSTKPEVQQACNTHVCTTSWKSSSWSRCSKTCGGGTQTRTVSCPNGFVCPGNKPSTNQACNTQTCTAGWTTSAWSSCSKACGGGTQTRTVTCPSGFVCPGAKPAASIACNMQLCQSDWIVGAWGSCAKDPISGNGLRKRSVTCPAGKLCSKAKPLEFKDCTASWSVGTWSSCNKSCGSGTQRRTVTCPSGAICKGVKPALVQSCNTHSCVANWKVGAWSGCSQKFCGAQTRSVTCPAAKCAGAKPATSKACNTSPGSFPKATCEDIWWAMEAGAPIPYDLNLFCAKPTCKGANRPSCPSRFKFIRSSKWKNSTSAWCLANNSVNL